MGDGDRGLGVEGKRGEEGEEGVTLRCLAPLKVWSSCSFIFEFMFKHRERVKLPTR